MTQPAEPIELLPIYRERIWGRESLAPVFTDQPRTERIGEVWYTFGENQTSRGKVLTDLLREYPGILGTAADPEHPDICPILVKLLFTSERLSVQVHPDDDYAKERHDSLGKTEAWYVVDAQPPGEVAVGFKQTITPERLATSARSGEIENLLDWRKVKAGDVIFTPAGTVHAIGAGLIICEVQENSDITYRLYDYGRPRELHLEHGSKVSILGPHNIEASPSRLATGRDELVSCPYFRIEKLTPTSAIHIAAALPYYSILVCVRGLLAGKSWLIPAKAGDVSLDTGGSEWIFTYTADSPAPGIAVI